MHLISTGLITRSIYVRLLTALMLIACAAFCEASCLPQPSGMVSWFKAEGDASDTLASNDGDLINGVQFTSGLLGSSFSFDGLDDYVAVPRSGAPESPVEFTIEFWMRASDQQPVGSALAGLVTSDWFGIEIGDAPPRQGIHLYISTDGGATFPTTSDVNGAGLVFPSGEWHHIAGTYDGAAIRLFLDGKVVGEATPVTGTVSSMTEYGFVSIGSESGVARCPQCADRFFKGEIDEVAIYERALTPAEIKAIHSSGVEGKCPNSTPPHFFNVLTNVVADAGEHVLLTAVAGGSSEVRYEWLFNGTVIPHETNSFLVIATAQLSHAGQYTLRAVNNLGAVETSAYVYVQSNLECPEEMLAWWRAEGNTADSIAGRHGTLEGGAMFGSGKVGQAFELNGSTSYVSSPDSDLWAFGTNDFSVDFWVNFRDLPPSSGVNLPSAIFIGNDQGTYWNPKWLIGLGAGQLFFHVWRNGTGDGIWLVNAPFQPTTNRWYHIAVTRGSHDFKAYVNGQEIGREFRVVDIPNPNGPLTIGQAENLGHVNGWMDEITIYGRSLSAAEISRVFSAGAAGKCKPAANCVVPPAGLVSWWKMEGDALDSLGGNHAVTNNFSFNSGKVGLAAEFTNSRFLTIENSPTLNPAASFSIEAWVRPRVDGTATILGKWGSEGAYRDQRSYYLGTVPGRGLIFGIADSAGQWDQAFHNFSVAGVLELQSWQHVVAVYDQLMGTRSLYVNGIRVGERVDAPIRIHEGVAAVGIGANLPSDSSSEAYFEGAIDELSFYNVALAPAEVAALHMAGQAGKCAAPAPPCLSAISNTVSWWRFENDAQDTMAANHGTMVNSPGFIPGTVGRALSFAGNQYVELTNSPSLSPTGSFSIEGWIYPRSDQHQAILAKWGITEDQFNQRSYNFGLIPSGGLQFSVTDYDRQWDASFSVLNAPGAVTLGAWSHVAAVFDQPTGTRRLFVNGAQVAEVVQEPFFVFNSSATPTIGAERNSSKSVSSFFDGLIDELAFYSRALSGAEVQSIYAAAAAGKCVVSPVITQQPANASVPVGGQIMLSVVATPVPVGYQWRLDGGALEGQTNQFLPIPEAAKTHAGAYDAVLTFSSGTSLTSQVATVSVLLPVVIKTQPASVQVPVSTGFSLTVEAEGDGSLGYQWFKNGNPLPGAFDRTLTVNWAQPSSAGVYHVVVNNDVSSATSEPAVVSVVAPPLVHLSPSHRAIEEGGSAVFTAWVSGAGWWQWSKDGLALNVTNLTLRIENAKVSDSGTYTLTVTNLAGKAVASAVLLVNERVYVTVLANGSPIVGTNAYVSEHPVQISLASVYPDANTYYTLDGSDPSFLSTLYTGPFTITRSGILRVRTYDTLFTESGASRPVEFVIVPRYTLSVTNAGGGSVSFTPDATSYASNTLVRLWAQPAPGWMFLGWLGAASGTNWDAEVRMTSDKTVQAVFGSSVYSVLTGNGALTADPPGPLYPYGTVVRFTAIPAEGHYLAAWGGSASGNANPAYVTVTNAGLQLGGITAELPPDLVALTTLPQGFGKVVSTPGTNLFRVGSTVTLNAIPEPGQEFIGWSGTLASTENPVSLELTNSAVLYANFTAAPTLNGNQPLAGLNPEGFTITVRGEYGSSYDIQTTTSLLEWTRLGTVTNPFGFSQFTDPAPGTNSMRLYRAVKQ